MKTNILVTLFIFSTFLQADDSKSSDVRVLISKSSEVKKDYLLTKKDLEKNLSHVDHFGKISWSIPEIVKLAEKHINEVQMPKIVPSMPWPPEEYNHGARYPVLSSDLKFDSMELRSHERYLYWKLHFSISDGIGATPHITCVVCYLNGEIAKIVDHEPEQD